MGKFALNPHLILGLGTSAQQLIPDYMPDYSMDSNHRHVRTETLDTYMTGLDGWNFDRDALRALLDTAAKVLLVVCAGGKGGAAMTLFSADYAIGKKIPLNVLMSTPFSWEGRRRATEANALVEKLGAVGVKVTVVDADSLITDEFDSAKEAFAVLHTAMMKEVELWVASAK